MPVQVIFLNGSSSTGKTSLAKALQAILPEPYMHIGIDQLIDMMPDYLNDWEGEENEGGFYWKKEIDKYGNKVSNIQLGPYALKVNKTLKDIVITMLKNGHNVIIESYD